MALAGSLPGCTDHVGFPGSEHYGQDWFDQDTAYLWPDVDDGSCDLYAEEPNDREQWYEVVPLGYLTQDEDVHVCGSIDETGIEYTSDTTYSYVGDLEYFAFQVLEALEISASLDWDDRDTELHLRLWDLTSDEEVAMDKEGNPARVSGTAQPDRYYVLIVLPYSGPDTDYELTVRP